MKKIIKGFLKIFLIIFIIALAIGICLGLYYGVTGYNEYKNALSQCSIEDRIAELKNEKNYVTIDQMPQIYKDAVIAVEDHDFYEHGAISFYSTLRAIFTNIKEGEFTQGGSTITQQLAKNLYFTQEKTLKRKVAELFMAIELEKHYDKDEILEFYLNSIYFGSGYYCVYDASMGYFNVEPKDMTDYQSTLLAGIPNAPSVYSPDNNTPLTAQRHGQVLDSMVKYNFLDRERADKILSDK